MFSRTPASRRAAQCCEAFNAEVSFCCYSRRLFDCQGVRTSQTALHLTIQRSIPKPTVHKCTDEKQGIWTIWNLWTKHDWTQNEKSRFHGLFGQKRNALYFKSLSKVSQNLKMSENEHKWERKIGAQFWLKKVSQDFWLTFQKWKKPCFRAFSGVPGAIRTRGLSLRSCISPICSFCHKTLESGYFRAFFAIPHNPVLVHTVHEKPISSTRKLVKS